VLRALLFRDGAAPARVKDVIFGCVICKDDQSQCPCGCECGISLTGCHPYTKAKKRSTLAAARLSEEPKVFNVSQPSVFTC